MPSDKTGTENNIKLWIRLKIIEIQAQIMPFARLLKSIPAKRLGKNVIKSRYAISVFKIIVKTKPHVKLMLNAIVIRKFLRISEKKDLRFNR